MITNKSQAAKHVFAFMMRETIPPRRARFGIESYIRDLRLELDWAQQTLKALDKQSTRKTPAKT
jgi:hypothetical protein